MKEHPILFSTPMVQALLAGRKTQTRRVVKFPLKVPMVQASIGDSPIPPPVRFCKWQPGDLLYVRESYRKFCPDVDTTPYETITEYAASENSGSLYESDGDGFAIFNKDGSERMIGWKPSIHMPKSAARIWLQVESVRVERLQDISEDDAFLEGCDRKLGHLFNMSCGESAEEVPHRRIFETLWQSINGPESWEANPWVWVVSFKVLSTTGRPPEKLAQ